VRLLVPVVLAGLLLAGCAVEEAPPLGVVQPPVPAVAAEPAIAALAPPALTGSGVLRVAVPAEAGAERELAEALAAKLGLRAVPDGVSATALPRALFENRHDLNVNPNVPPTPGRGAALVPWIAARTAIVTPPGNPDRVEATTLCGHRIGVVAGSAQHADVKQRDARCRDNRQQPITIVPLAGAADAARRVLADELDAFVADTPAAGTAVVAGKGWLEKTNSPTWGEGSGAILAPEALAPAVSEALASLVADGTYDTILSRWLLSADSLPPPTP
jgi:polar amino acid transport system substrate-binding protein